MAQHPTEGWWRYVFDAAGAPFDYIIAQTVAKKQRRRICAESMTSLSLVFAPVGRSALDAINGIPTWKQSPALAEIRPDPKPGRHRQHCRRSDF